MTKIDWKNKDEIRKYKRERYANKQNIDWNESRTCKYCSKVFYKREFRKNFNRMITCGSLECIKKYKGEWAHTKVCPDCGKSIVRDANRCHRCAVLGKNNPFYGKTHTEETKKKLKLFTKGMIPPQKGKNYEEMYGMEKSQKIKEIIRSVQLGRKHSKEHIRKRLTRRTPSSLERKMINIISKYNLPYKFVGDGKFFIERKNPDFININGEKIAIEVFYRKHKEMFSGGLLNWMEDRKNIFNKYNWKLLFFNEIQVNDNEVRMRLKWNFLFQ